MREVASVQPRRQLWEKFEVPFHLTLIDDSLDENDRDHNLLWKELQSIKKLLIGIMVSTTTASILLALSIVTDSI